MHEFDTMPGGEPIIIERVPVMTYCGRCMTEMKCVHGHHFACPMCGMDYEKEEGT